MVKSLNLNKDRITTIINRLWKEGDCSLNGTLQSIKFSCEGCYEVSILLNNSVDFYRPGYLNNGISSQFLEKLNLVFETKVRFGITVDEDDEFCIELHIEFDPVINKSFFIVN